MTEDASTRHHASARYRHSAGLLSVITLHVLSLPAVAQEGVVTGTVTDARTFGPLGGAQVFVTATTIGTLTGAEGTYRLDGVPAGEAIITVRLIGYKELSHHVTVTAGETTTVDVGLEQTALKLQEIVVTGVVGETPRVKLPFTVDVVDTDDLPVPATNAAALLAGRTSGFTIAGISGLPGSAPDMIARGPTSIYNEGRTQRPLIVIDGIIQSENATLSDIGSLDIDHVEIVKGAAAASLYGSRAQTGVINITTKRGTGLSAGDANLLFRGEYGSSSLSGDSPFPTLHPWLMNETGTKFIDSNGNELDWVQFGNPLPDGTPTGSPVLAGGDQTTTFQSFDHPTRPYDNIDRFFEPSQTWMLYGAATGRSPTFGYRASLDWYRETGIVDCGDACRNPLALENFGEDFRIGDNGFSRVSGRINVDAEVNDLDISASAFYSRSTQDDTPQWQGVFGSLLLFDPFRDLIVPDEEGLPAYDADPTSAGVNPLHLLATAHSTVGRTRSMGSASFRYRLTSDLTIEGDASYDATALSIDRYSDTRNPTAPNGRLIDRRLREEALNASATAAYARSWLDGRLVTRARARVLGERQDYDNQRVEGIRFSVTDVPNFGAIEGGISASNEVREIRSLGLYGIVGADLDGRYIADALVRRDGSSLFGSGRRWHTYYRGSLAWRISQEPWWGLDWVDELKIRGSLGTAGGRPTFALQYETFDVSDGAIRPITLGNKQLTPERSLEREVGADLALFNNLGVMFTYAWATTDDQILRVPLPGFVGYSTQWMNAGELKSNTIEASIRWAPIDNPKTGLNFRVSVDRTRTMITRLDVPDFTASGFYFAEGVPMGSLWGPKYAANCPEVARGLGFFSTDGFDCGQFQVNDEGYMVWVGEGHQYTDGIAHGLWGTDGTVNGKSVNWGMPIETLQQNPTCLGRHPEDAGVGERCPLQDLSEVGKTQPDFSASMATSFRHGGLAVNVLLDAAIGFDLFNLSRGWGVSNRRPERDQSWRKPQWLWKPVGYYANRNGFLNGLEPGGWVKVRELAIGYTLPQSVTSMLLGGGIERATLTVVGRNLLTFTDYSGFDPDVGVPNSDVGSATIDRWDQFQYPPSRTISLALELVF